MLTNKSRSNLVKYRTAVIKTELSFLFTFKNAGESDIRPSLLNFALHLHSPIGVESFFNTIFVSSHMYPDNPEGTQVIVGSMNMGYISDTARNRTHNVFRPKREPIPLGH